MPAPSSPVTQNPVWPPRRALVVEDAFAVGALFQDVISTHFRCLTTLAATVEEAIGYLEKENVDLVVCDLALVGGSGLDVAAWLRDHRPALARRLLIITACARDHDLTCAVQREEVRVLYKPFNATALINAVGQACATTC